MSIASKSKSKQEEALEFLDDLDNFAAPEPASGSTAPPPPADASKGKTNEAEVFAFIDEITQKSIEPIRPTRSGTPTTIRKSTERVRLGGGPISSSPSASASTTSLHRTASSEGSRVKAEASPARPVETATSSGGWGWGSVWNTASAAIQQAKSVVDEQVKHLPQNDQVRGLGAGLVGYAKNAQEYAKHAQEYAKTAQLDKLGQDLRRVGLSTLTDILNVVAPPISEHEVIQIWLTHDMQGYEGIEKLVYRAMARILEQVEGGDLIVNRGDEIKPKGDASGARSLNAVEGYEAAVKLAQVEVEELTKTKKTEAKASELSTPITYSNVYVRVQPFFSKFPLPESVSSAGAPKEVSDKLQFLIYLYDPEHKLVHTSLTQAVPSQWIDIWDEHDWVEDLVVEALRVSVEVIGQEYVVGRMGWVKKPQGDESSSGEEETDAEESEDETPAQEKKKLGNS